MAISDLDPTQPPSDGPAGQGDDFLRLTVQALLESFPALNGLISNTQASGDPGDTDPPDAATWTNLFAAVKSLGGQGTFQPGMIMAWSGDIGSIPAGWLLCAANNAPAPDLSDRFIIGAGDQYSVGDTGGAVGEGATGPAGQVQATVNIADHVLTLSNLPQHNHKLFGPGDASGGSPDVGQNDATAVKATAGGGDDQRYIMHADPSSPTTLEPTLGRSAYAGQASPSGLTHPDASVQIPNHSHSLEGALPPYYALAFIYYAGA